jgi:GNAT superfamily N-acetyltransferase
MGGSVSIRSMRAGEETQVCALVARVFNEFVAPDFDDDGIVAFFSYANPKELAARQAAGECVLVAEMHARIVGMLELRGFDHIAMLFVETRGHGIGRLLFERALQACRERSPGSARMTVHASRYAVPVYAKLGFDADGPERTENGITYVPMSLPLKADT